MKSRSPYSPVDRLLTVPAFLLLFLLGGCSDATEVQDSGSSKIPGVGSTFSTHIFFQNDSLTLENDVDVVVGAANMIVEGKERVVQYVADTLSALLCYELNGDISFYMKRGTIAGCEVENTWLRFPFGEQGLVEEKLRVTRIDLPGEPKECLATWRAEPNGEEVIAVNGHQYRTRRAVAEFIVGGESGDDITDTAARIRRYEVWFSPQIGYVVREQITSTIGPIGAVDTIGVSRRNLQSFSLR
jgi:hypothetical protein